MIGRYVRTCSAGTTTYPCGCVLVEQLVTLQSIDQLDPRKGTIFQCETCGKFHVSAEYLNQKGQFEFRNCSLHATQFQLFAFAAHSEFEPGIDWHKTLRCLGEEGDRCRSWKEDEKWKLVEAVIATKDQDNICLALHLDLTPAMQEKLVESIKKRLNASWALELPLQLGKKTKIRLRWILTRSKLIHYIPRIVLVGMAIAALFWHLPDWRSILTIAAVVVAYFAVTSSDWIQYR